MADTYRRDEASSYKRPSTETSSETIPSKKPSIGFNIKSSTSNKKPATTTKILKPGAMKKNLNPIALKLAKDKTKTEPTVVKKSSKVAAVFNEDSDSEPEEIPPEAKMRMKNIGRNTPTSSGPNSFNKGKLGFCDGQRLWEKKQQEIARKHQSDQS